MKQAALSSGEWSLIAYLLFSSNIGHCSSSSFLPLGPSRSMSWFVGDCHSSKIPGRSYFGKAHIPDSRY
jgi:hypothetical protein